MCTVLSTIDPDDTNVGINTELFAELDGAGVICPELDSRGRSLLHLSLRNNTPPELPFYRQSRVRGAITTASQRAKWRAEYLPSHGIDPRL